MAFGAVGIVLGAAIANMFFLVSDGWLFQIGPDIPSIPGFR